ncbi:phosphate ABC transporter permease PstA [Pyrofollis japonicus]|uniref:PstA family ABC transporter permease n=1 Tax=Pyrofollis japonicus TaxID=3060460 RepID=UPI00295AD8E1|nr:ABC transporter permease subunit [Pyrofollis japonicus]BEP17181.1 phosphate ABC transporter permease PstA [Pyrofollis japonicus]
MLDSRLVKEKLFLVTIFALTFIGVLPVFYVLAEVFVKGTEALAKHGTTILTSTSNGIVAPILGSAILSIAASILGIPLAILAGFFVAEFPETRIARITRVMSRSLLEVPTVLLGMLVYIIMVVPMGRFSLLAGAVALALVMLPYVMVHVEQAIESVPPIYREAGYSIGMTRAEVLFGIIAGIARRGIATGVLMGFAKAMGETAPLLFTIGAARSALPCSQRPVILNLLEPGDAIPLMVFQYAQMPQPIYHDMAWAGSLLLVIAFLLVFLAVRSLVKEVRL